MQLAVVAKGRGSPHGSRKQHIGKLRAGSPALPSDLWAAVPDKADIALVPHLTHGVRHLSLVDSVRQHARNVRLTENLLDVDLMCSNCALTHKCFAMRRFASPLPLRKIIPLDALESLQTTILS